MIARILLQIDCSGSDPPLYCHIAKDRNLWDGIFQPWVQGLEGWAIFALFLTIPAVIALFRWSESVYIPAMAVALLGGTLFATLPGIISMIAGRLLVVVVAAMILLVWIRLS